MSLTRILWIVGSVIAAAGMQVYVIWGIVRPSSPYLKWHFFKLLRFQALPHNGGEKNYLEYLFPKPKHLITSLFAANSVLIGKINLRLWRSPVVIMELVYSANNSLVFAEYALASLSSGPSPSSAIFSPVRLVAFVSVTGVFLLHGLHIRAGIQLQNLLGFMKIGILLIVVGSGFVALSGNIQEGVPRPGNFDSWERVWDGSRTGGSVLCNALYSVCYISSSFLIQPYNFPGHILLHGLQQRQLRPFRGPKPCSDTSDSRSTRHQYRYRPLPLL